MSVILPNKAKKYKESLGLKSKNDRIDAKGLSRMACEQSQPCWQPSIKQLYELRLITRQIESIAAQITVLNNQLEALILGMFRDKEVERMLKKQISTLEKYKQRLMDKIQKVVDSDKLLKQKCNHIVHIKGLGLLTVAIILAGTGGVPYSPVALNQLAMQAMMWWRTNRETSKERLKYPTKVMAESGVACISRLLIWYAMISSPFLTYMQECRSEAK